MGAWMHARHGGSCAHVEPGETATKPVGAPHTARGGLRTCTEAEDWARVWGTERPIRAWSLCLTSSEPSLCLIDRQGQPVTNGV